MFPDVGYKKDFCFPLQISWKIYFFLQKKIIFVKQQHAQNILRSHSETINELLSIQSTRFIIVPKRLRNTLQYWRNMKRDENVNEKSKRHTDTDWNLWIISRGRESYGLLWSSVKYCILWWNWIIESETRQRRTPKEKHESR